MTLTIELPNDLAQHEDPAQEALEALAVEAYRTGALSRPEAAKLAGVGRLGFTDLLYRHGLPTTTYGVEEFMEDVRTGDALRAAGKIPG